MKNKIKNLICCVAGILLISSCEKKEEGNQSPLPDNLNGVFVINEGAFLSGNASISFFSSDSNFAVPDIFQAANGFPLGDILQSMTVFNNSAYLCVNNSQKTEVVSLTDFKRTGIILGANSPRYFCGYTSSKGFLSDWNSNNVYMINLANNTITDSIPCGQGPEQMLIAGQRLFICNSGGFSDDSTITIADANTLSLITNFASGVNPASICKDRYGKIWILCRGSLGSDYTATPDDPGGKLMRIDPVSLNTELVLSMNYDEHPIRLCTNAGKDTLYYLMGSSAYTGDVYRMSIYDNNLPLLPLINTSFYSIGIHPNGIIYAGKANFSSASYMYRFNNNGTLIDSSEVGIGPNSFVFN